MSNRIELEGVPITSDVPMLYDEKIYKIYVVIKNNDINYSIIKAVSKVCGLNYIGVKKKLKEGKNLIFEGNAYEIKDVLEKLLNSEVQFEVKPPYPYGNYKYSN